MANSIEGATKGNTTAEGERYDIPVLLPTLMESEERHVDLVPTEVGFTEKLSSQLQPAET
ncbi:MAG: hypothetical protein HY080_06105 [Gammaproteobacteria bacterium]|nr:hypothetical protein [Gammaproteobacteria bacterium]